MKLVPKIAACAVALSLVAACGERRAADGTSAEEREKLDRIAENLDGGDVVDTSPDSLVANDEWVAAESGEAAGTNGAAPANGSAGNRP